MSLPLLEYAPLSQNHRVEGFEVPGDEQPRIYTTAMLLSRAEFDLLIQAAYRQIFNEQQMLAHHRQRLLESQLRAGQITVKEFIRGLVLSDSFRRLTFESNNNYRFVEICVQRVLGRNVYGDREKLSWSIVLATQGIQAFVDGLINSEEYDASFGDHTVPYQRRRILPRQTTGEVTFAHMARYGTDYRNKLPKPYLGAAFGPGFTGPAMSPTRWDWQKNPPTVVGQVGKGLVWFGVAFLALLVVAVLLGF